MNGKQCMNVKIELGTSDGWLAGWLGSCLMLASPTRRMLHDVIILVPFINCFQFSFIKITPKSYIGMWIDIDGYRSYSRTIYIIHMIHSSHLADSDVRVRQIHIANLDPAGPFAFHICSSRWLLFVSYYSGVFVVGNWKLISVINIVRYCFVGGGTSW